MTTTQIGLVQATFKMLEPDEAAQLFYSRLFEMDPSLRSIFRGDMREQGRKLMQMIGVGVTGLPRLEQLLPVVEQLGSRHAGYGVRDEHYVKVAAALLWTLHRGLGDAFTPAVCDAWIAMYEVVSSAMQRGVAVMTSAA